MPKHAPKTIGCRQDRLQTLADDLHDMLDDAFERGLCGSCVSSILISCVATIIATLEPEEAMDMVADMNEQLRLLTIHVLRSSNMPAQMRIN
jgi:hypothetical protein